MKKILPPLLPALALLTLGGCASSSTLTTTENDGMYYSSADRVTAPVLVASAAPTDPAASEEAPAASSGDVDNPDYAAGSSRSATTTEAEYYDDDYYYASRLRRFHSPYRGIGMGYYDFAYTDPFWYGGPAFGYSPYSSWAYGGYGVYDPFFSPWGYGGVTINIGFGRPWGWGRPWGGYGYGYSPYDRFGWGGYGYPGYYGGFNNGWGGYYGGNGGWATGYDRPGRTTTYGPRRGRTVDSPGIVAPTGTGTATNGRRRIQEGGFADPNTGGVSTSGAVAQPNLGSRRRGQEAPTAGGATEAAPTVTLDRSRLSRTQPDPTSTTPAEGGRRWRVLDNTTSGGTASPSGQPVGTATEPMRRRRADYPSTTPGGGSGSGYDQPAEQPRVAEQPRRQRVYTPAPEPTRTYEQPTYERPTRSAEPSRSYSEPSRSSSNYGGGNSGGSNSGGSSSGGGRRRN